MRDFRSRTERNSTLLAILSSISLVVFAILWELRWAWLLRTLTSRQETTEHWVERALHDPLTNLPNRSLLKDRIEQALIRAQRNQTSVAVLFLDLDNFKMVNDEYGHLVGDQLLTSVGDRLRQHLRASDTAARLGGDEFVVLLEIRNASDPVMTVADRLRRALHVPLLLEPAPIALRVSIGIAISQAGQESTDDLLRKADLALLQAKQSGKDQVVLGATDETNVPVEMSGSRAMD